MRPRAVSAGLLGLACIACAPTHTPGQQSAGVLGLYDFERPTASFEMPGRLDEISGLAMTPEGRLFGHDDERGTVHEIDRATGEVGKRFSIGDPPMQGDFEGLAVVGERFFLVTSEGLLHEFREVGDRETSPHRVTDLGLRGSCEIEGLEHDAEDDALLVPCKSNVHERGLIVVHRVPIDPQRARPAPLEIPRAELPAFGIREDFQPSSVAATPAGTILLSSAAPEALLEVDRTGRVIGGVDLPGSRHPQTEGIAFGPDGTLYLADERNGPDAHVTAYARGPAPVGAP
jgi:uncharacterized protein YjiK